MSTATFDTHQAVRRLEAAGIETRQAEAIVSEVRDAATADRADLATKADLAALEARMYRALWIQAAALIGAQLAIAGFVVHLLSQ